MEKRLLAKNIPVSSGQAYKAEPSQNHLPALGAKQSFQLRKILKVSHFSLGFSLDEKCDKIKTSHRVLPEFSYSYRVSLVFSRSGSKISNRAL